MNLLGILLKALLSEGALKALAKKTGLSSKQLKKVLPLAVPLLLKMLTKNASDKDGALSLLGALTQHTSKKSMAQQVEEADTEATIKELMAYCEANLPVHLVPAAIELIDTLPTNGNGKVDYQKLIRN